MDCVSLCEKGDRHELRPERHNFVFGIIIEPGDEVVRDADTVWVGLEASGPVSKNTGAGRRTRELTRKRLNGY